MIEVDNEDTETTKAWLKEAEEVKDFQALMEFIRKLQTEYKHGYNSSAYAGVAAMMATFHTMNSELGYTGFQAGYMGMLVLRKLAFSEDSPLRVIDFEKMLYPQYDRYFTDRTINAETWKWLRKEAEKNLEKNSPHAHQDVVEHQKAIVDGKIPFGYVLE